MVGIHSGVGLLSSVLGDSRDLTGSVWLPPVPESSAQVPSSWNPMPVRADATVSRGKWVTLEKRLGVQKGPQASFPPQSQDPGKTGFICPSDLTAAQMVEKTQLCSHEDIATHPSSSSHFL